MTTFTHTTQPTPATYDYNGRQVLAQVAQSAGWRAISFNTGGVYAPGLPKTAGVEYVGYQPAVGNAIEVVIGWTARDTAHYVFVAGVGEVFGVGALITAREHIEASAVVTA